MKLVVAQHPVSPPAALDIMSSNCSSPYISAPSTPHHPLNLFFYSTPTSPRFSSSSCYYHHHHNNDQSFFLGDDDDDDLAQVSLLSHEEGLPSFTAKQPSSSSSVPFNWELMPGVPKSFTKKVNDDDEQEEEAAATTTTESQGNEDSSFEFDFSGQLDMMLRPSLSSADELFDGGKIKPLKPPPRLLHVKHDSLCESPKSPIMSKFKDALSLSPRHTDDPFEAALHNSTRNDRGRGRGRGRQFDDSSGNSMKRGNSRKGMSRSLSPLRVSEFALLHQQQTSDIDKNSNTLSSSRGGSKKWRLKDLFLFRSASEGRASAKDPLRKLFSFSRRNSSSMDNKDEGSSNHSTMMNNNDSKNSSFRSSSGSVSKRTGGGKVSAHEMHYTAKRAVSEELKKKTSLPYKHGLLSCLGFNPLLHDLSRAFGSISPSS